LVWSSVAFAATCVAVVREDAWLTIFDGALGGPAQHATASHDGLRSFWSWIDTVQSPHHQRLIMLAAAVLLAASRRWALAVRVVLVVVAAWWVAPTAKSVFQRQRPTWPDSVMVLESFSFPSGHAVAGWVLACVAVLVAAETCAGVRRVAIMVCAAGAAVLVSLDRVFLGVHYVSDVAGGAFLAVAVTCAAWLVVPDRLARAVVGDTAEVSCAHGEPTGRGIGVEFTRWAG
jgi:membrane-associated phospholipid phosphatase